MKNSILIPVNDSFSSKAALKYMRRFYPCADKTTITLIHVYRKPAAGNELMGERFIEEQPGRYLLILENAKQSLIEYGFPEKNIEVKIINDPCETVGDGIIDECKKGEYSMVVIGRRKKSKAEEFIKGDLCIKLVRELEGVAVLAVRTK